MPACVGREASSGKTIAPTGPGRTAMPALDASKEGSLRPGRAGKKMTYTFHSNLLGRAKESPPPYGYRPSAVQIRFAANAAVELIGRSSVFDYSAKRMGGTSSKPYASVSASWVLLIQDNIFATLSTCPRPT